MKRDVTLLTSQNRISVVNTDDNCKAKVKMFQLQTAFVLIRLFIGAEKLFDALRVVKRSCVYTQK